MTSREITLLCEAWFCQATTGLLLKIIPFRMIPRLYKNPGATTAKSGDAAADIALPPGQHPLNKLLPQQIKTAIKRTSPFTPWKNRCLVQSLAARRMLFRRGIPSQLFLGVAFNSREKMIAHAWLKTDDCEMVEKNGDFMELYYF